jgi:ADP-ribose pyrophosphatase YjhB (NUDIX family)
MQKQKRADRGPFRLIPYFSSLKFDRRSALWRRDRTRLDRLRHEPGTRFVLLYRGWHLALPGDAPVLARLTLSELGIPAASLRACREVFLGQDADGALFGLDASGLEKPPAVPGTRYVELRPYDFLFDREDAAVMAQFRGMRADAGARPEPVAVVLPVHGDHVLLTRRMRSETPTLSAFTAPVEAGEMVEQSAARQVRDTLGLRARRLHYHSSQPWPFPNAILMGFHFQCASMDDLRFDDAEIDTARWFTREDIFNHEELGFELPDPRTLSGQLLKRWMMCGDMFEDYVPPAATGKPARATPEKETA